MRDNGIIWNGIADKVNICTMNDEPINGDVHLDLPENFQYVPAKFHGKAKLYLQKIL